MISYFKKKNNGLVNALLGTIIAIFFLVVVVFLSIEPLRKASIYNQITDISRAAILRCEADGGLTNETKQEILKALKQHGLDPDLATISCNKQGADSYPTVTTFGADITLTISYKYVHDSLKEIGFIFNKTPNTETITKTISTTAKN